jgi:Reverse transcriptase (RNA-dependent DNA polymerase)
VVEDVLKGGPVDCRLPVVVYLDDIAVFGDDQTEVLEDTLEAIRCLTDAGFMINLTKSQLVESTAKVLGH